MQWMVSTVSQDVHLFISGNVSSLKLCLLLCQSDEMKMGRRRDNQGLEGAHVTVYGVSSMSKVKGGGISMAVAQRYFTNIFCLLC